MQTFFAADGSIALIIADSMFDWQYNLSTTIVHGGRFKQWIMTAYKILLIKDEDWINEDDTNCPKVKPADFPDEITTSNTVI